MRLRLLGIVAVAVLALGAGGAHKGKAPAPECQTDGDCVLVADGCCGCNEGGKQRGIPARARDGYEKKRKTACRSSACPALMSEDASCLTGHAVCQTGKCGLGK
jgi:hypothetical protein